MSGALAMASRLPAPARPRILFAKTCARECRSMVLLSIEPPRPGEDDPVPQPSPPPLEPVPDDFPPAEPPPAEPPGEPTPVPPTPAPGQ